MSGEFAANNPGLGAKLEPGTTVGQGRFTLVRILGEGGMGVVWLARDTHLGEEVALKFLPPDVCHDPAALNDLRKETARSHRLTHPNIIRIHDFHQQPDGLAFISMEFVEGKTLSELRLQQPNQVFSWERLVPLVKQLCIALDYAHGEGVIHRDLKPANVMRDSRDRVKLADFGIAAVVSDSMSRATARTSTKSGTLAYMSPQQLRGQPATVGDDVYALGATLYELLTGRPPFYTGDVTHQILNEPPTPLAMRCLSLGVENPVPQAAAALIMDCLSKDAAQRPASATAVAARVELPPPPPPPPSPKRSRPVAAIAVVALLAIGLGVAAWKFLLPPTESKKTAQQQGTNAPTEVRFNQPFFVHGPGGPGDLLPSGDLALLVQCRDSSSNAPVGADGQALLKELPAAWKDQEASISVVSRDWRLAGPGDGFRLSGEKITLGLERRDILIHGLTVDAGSNSPLSGVVVAVEGVTNVSDAQGEFKLPIPGRLIRPSMTLTAQRPRYQPASRVLTNLADKLSVALAPVPPPPPAATIFSQVLALHGPAGASDLPKTGDVEVLLQSGEQSYRTRLNALGEAVFTNLPVALKNHQADVSISAREWRLPKGTNVIQLSGERLAVGMDRWTVAVRGSVAAVNGTPLAGVSVIIGGVTNTTDKSGRFAVSLPGKLAEGQLSISAALAGFQPFTSKVSDVAKEQVVSLSPVVIPPPPPVPQTSSAPAVAVTAQPAVSTNTGCSYWTQPPVEKMLADGRAQLDKGGSRAMKKADELSKLAVTEYRTLAEKEFARYGTALGIALLFRAEVFVSNPGAAEADQCYREARETLAKLGPGNPSAVNLARVLNNYAVRLSQLRDPRQSQRIVDAYHQAITGYSNAVPACPAEALPGLANTFWNLALHQLEVTNLAAATSACQETARIYQALPPTRDAEALTRRVRVQRELASIEARLNQREKARADYLAACAACEPLKPVSERLYLEELARIQHDLASFLEPFDKTAAVSAYDQTIGLYRQLAKQSSWTNRVIFADALNSYAVMLAKLDSTNHIPAVGSAYEEAARQCQAAGDHALEVQILCNHGRFLANQRLLTQARVQYAEALRVGHKYLDDQPDVIGPRLAETHLNMAEVEYDLRFGLDRDQWMGHLRAASKEVSEARKLISKLPSSIEKSELEQRAQSLASDIARATPK